jgi:hypothetical protein
MREHGLSDEQIGPVSSIFDLCLDQVQAGPTTE